jgi:hypothetical protein
MALTYNQVPATYNIRLVSGDDLLIPFQIGSEDANGVFTATNITGYTFETSIQSGSVTVSGTVDLISASNGTVTANYTEVMTGSLKTGCYHWNLRMTDTQNYTRTILHGDVEVICNG